MSTNPYQAPDAPPARSTVSSSDITKAWLGFILLSTVVGFFAGMVFGAILGAFLGGLGVTIGNIQIICAIAGFLINFPVSFIFFRRSVTKLLSRCDEKTTTA